MNSAEKYIIPHQTFRGMYDGVLRVLQRDSCVTNSERKLLVAVSEALQNNDERFLTRHEIGRKIGVGAHQVGNITRTLKKKGLVKVIPPAMSDRHVYRKCNSYRFLYHEMYKPLMAMTEKQLQTRIRDHYWSSGEPFPDYLGPTPTDGYY